MSSPYTPPRAEVADTPEVLPPRPRSVSVALGLVLGGVLVQILANVYAFQEHDFHFERPMASLKNGAYFLLLMFLCHQIAKRRSWPRIVLLVLVLLTFAQVCFAIGAAHRYLTSEEIFSMLMRYFIVQIVPLAMNLAALHLLFFSSGNWFRRRESA